MNEDHLPPGDPKTQEEFPRHQRLDTYDPPNFWGMVLLGVLLLFVCCSLCAPFNGPGPLFFGGFVAFLSLFGRGYRGLFVGYAVPIGLVFLLLIAICGNSRPSL